MGRLDMSELLSAQIGLPTRCEQTFLKYGCSHVHTTQPFVAYSIRRTAPVTSMARVNIFTKGNTVKSAQAAKTPKTVCSVFWN
jgi:hypothetical protein